MRTLQPYRLRTSQKGFTLIEGLVVVIILGVLAATSFTLYTGLVARSSLDTFSNNLTNAIRLARTRAIGDMDGFMVCPSKNGETCSGAPSDYTSGILVVRRVVDNSTSSGGQVVRYFEGVNKVKIMSAEGSTDGGMAFNKNGMPSPGFAGLKLQVGYYSNASTTEPYRAQWVCVNKVGSFSVLGKNDGDKCAL